MGIAPKWLGNDLLELGFDFVDRLSGCEAGTIADPKDMGVDGECFLAERSVENDIGGLSTDSWKFLKFAPGARNLALIFLDQHLAEENDVLGLGVEQSDRLDRLAQGVFPQFDHLVGLGYRIEQ